MSSRDKILATVKNNQPTPRDLPPLPGEAAYTDGTTSATPYTTNAPASTANAPAPDLTPHFITTLEAIGGAAFLVSGFDRIATILHEQYPDARRILTGCPQLKSFAEATTGNPHALEDVDLAVLPAHFGVAENGACWITESQMIERALPFITQHLVLVLHRQDIVATMHEAYDRIAVLEAAATATNPATTGTPAATAANQATTGAPAATPYNFATFIAGPSKTADIEQSLVLGAHGPRSLTVFLLDEHLSDAGFY